MAVKKDEENWKSFRRARNFIIHTIRRAFPRGLESIVAMVAIYFALYNMVKLKLRLASAGFRWEAIPEEKWLLMVISRKHGG